MSSISTIALSGMNAASRRLEVSASNISNINSTGTLPNADGSVPTGAPRAYTPSTIAVSDPQAPFANQSGLVAAPNVDLAQEAIGQLMASYSFAANATVLKADDRMTKALLDITA
jgi:flagellar basal-body rod protein FlgC